MIKHYIAANFSLLHKVVMSKLWGFPGSSACKESTCNAGDSVLIPGLGRSPGEGNDNTLQYSCLENHMDRGAWQTTVYGVTKSQTWLRDWTGHSHNNKQNHIIDYCIFDHSLAV